MIDNPGQLNPRHVRRRFDRAAAGFDTADFVHRRCFDGLLERITPMRIEPLLVLDLGCATGRGSRRLAKTYRKSRVIGLDISAGMLRSFASGRWRLPFSRVSRVQGDAARIPLQAGSVDLVVANLLLPWMDDLPACFAEIGRVLKKGGLFAFATLGPDSLRPLQEAWPAATGGEDPHVHCFPDMHIVGDALVRAGLADPVVDTEYLEVTYRDSTSMFADLGACGARNCLVNRRRTLTGKGRFRAMRAALERNLPDGTLALGLELVFGHAWGGGPRLPAGEFHLAPAAIGRRARS